MSPPPFPNRELAAIQPDGHPDVGLARSRWKQGRGGRGVDGGNGREWRGQEGWEHGYKQAKSKLSKETDGCSALAYIKQQTGRHAWCSGE